MPRIRSLLTTVRLDLVKNAHNCQGDPGHRLQRDERRLAVKNGRGWDNYCLACGRRILQGDAARIAQVLNAIDTADR